MTNSLKLLFRPLHKLILHGKSLGFFFLKRARSGQSSSAVLQSRRNVVPALPSSPSSRSPAAPAAPAAGLLRDVPAPGSPAVFHPLSCSSQTQGRRARCCPWPGCPSTDSTGVDRTGSTDNTGGTDYAGMDRTGSADNGGMDRTGGTDNPGTDRRLHRGHR